MRLKELHKCIFIFNMQINNRCCPICDNGEIEDEKHFLWPALITLQTTHIHKQN